MELLICSYIILVIISFFDIVKISNFLKKFFLFIEGILMFLLIAFRENVPDLISYEKMYYRSSFNTLNFLQDPFFGIYMNISKSLGLSYREFIILNSFIFVFLAIVLLKNMTKYTFSFMLLFFTTTFLLKGFSQIRNAIAIMIFIFSLRYIEKENFFKYFLSILIASMFHISSIAYIFLYFFRNIKINIKILFITYVITATLYFINIDVVGYLFKIINLPRLQNYYDRAVISGEKKMFVMYLLMFLFLFFYKYIKFTDIKIRKNIVIIGVFFMFIIRSVFSAYGEIGTRLGDNFEIFQNLIIISFISITNKTIDKLVIIFLIIIFSFVNIYYMVFMKDSTFSLYTNMLLG